MTRRYRASRRHLLAGALAVPGALVAKTALGQPGRIVVRAWGGVWVDSLDRGVSKPFTEATGIAVDYDVSDDNEIQPKIWEAVEQGRRPPVHVNWDTTVNATKSALEGVAEDLSGLPNLNGLLPIARPAGRDGWPFVNTYAYVYVLAYRDAAFPEASPSSWQALLDPKYNGRIAIYDDGIGLHAAAQIAGGGKLSDMPGDMRPCWAFFERLKANQPRLGEDPDITAWFEDGTIDLACTIMSNARAARQDGIGVSWTVPREGAALRTDALWIPKGLPDDELTLARQYIDLALSAGGQQAWCNGLGLPPVRPGLEPPPDLAGDPAYPTSSADHANLIRVPEQVLVEHQRDWFARVRAIMEA